VAIPSVTGTADEARFGFRLRELIAASPAFTGSPDDVWTIQVGDRLERVCVAALVRGSGSRTVVLTGHFDTVRVDDYGPLAPLAFEPDRLRGALIEQLAGEAANPAARLALADLRGGGFLPGRGLLDMKSGLAAGLAALEAFASDAPRMGNLLFLAVPDEEANSAGARRAAEVLPEIGRAHALEIEAAINLDACIDDGDGEDGRCVALGTVGKLLPSALVVGRPVHASNARAGLNAGALAAELILAVEWAERLTDRTGEELGAPPTLLGVKDSRTAYDVTTPDRVWAYWNVMTHRRSPEEVLATLKTLGSEAASHLQERLQRRVAEVSETTSLEVEVMTAAELREAAVARDPDALTSFARRAKEIAERGLDLPEQCRILTEHLWAASGRAGPAIVLGFASLPYLPTLLQAAAGERLKRAVSAAVSETAERSGVPIRITQVFPGISDMSFLGQADTASVPFLAANTPNWDTGVGWPRNGAAGVPIVNAGPWGRDYHTPLERAHADYAFGVLPKLVLSIARNVLTSE
jgi:arginine utilization protein RocB